MVETTVAFKMIPTDMWDNDLFQVVGEIAIAFAQLEHVLWLSPKRINNIPFADWEDMAGRLTIPDRCRQIEEIYALNCMNQDDEAELGQVIAIVHDLAKRRNAVMHARWGCKKDPITQHIASRHRIWKSEDLGADVQALKDLRDEIRRARDRLVRYSW